MINTNASARDGLQGLDRLSGMGLSILGNIRLRWEMDSNRYNINSVKHKHKISHTSSKVSG